MTEKDEAYRKIETLILRNDFHTAETLLKKSTLPPGERQALEVLAEERQKILAADRTRKLRRRRVENWLGNFNLSAWKGFLLVYLLLGLIVAPYDNLEILRPLFGRRGGILMTVLNGLDWMVLEVWLLFLALEEQFKPPEKRDRAKRRDLFLGTLGLLALAVLQILLGLHTVQ